MVARYVTRVDGGHGAVRDALEHLLRATGQWDEIIAHYRGTPSNATRSTSHGA
jgi:3-deoxy-D-manno-octulosonate 8-phosphate phosphatase KdsC-like HAD superfamily phosphatase